MRQEEKGKRIAPVWGKLFQTGAILAVALAAWGLFGCQRAPTGPGRAEPPCSPLPTLSSPAPDLGWPEARIGFTVRKQGTPTICTVQSDGSDLTCIFSDPRMGHYATWSPDGSSIAFSYSLEGVSYIYAVNSDGTGLRQLSKEPNSLGPMWSPDGGRIAYQVTASDGAFDDIFVLNIRTGEVRCLTDSRGRNILIDWAPDGKQLFFYSDRDGDRLEIYVVNVDGTERRKLTDTGFDKTYADLSPDGARLLFVGATARGEEVDPVLGTSDTGYCLFVMNSDGTGLRQLPIGGQIYDPTWSPEGDKILFVGDAPRGIYTIDADGTGLRMVFEGNVAHPRWSPDGTRIAFRCDGDICVLDRDGSNPRALNTGMPGHSYLEWIVP